MRSGIITCALSLGYDITWTKQTHLFILCVPNNFFIKANFQLIVNVFHCGKKSTFNFNMVDSSIQIQHNIFVNPFESPIWRLTEHMFVPF